MENELNEEQKQLANELMLEHLEDMKSLKWRFWSSIFSLALSSTGYFLLFFLVGWKISLAVFLVLWGDNITTYMNTKSQINQALIKRRIEDVNKRKWQSTNT